MNKIDGFSSRERQNVHFRHSGEILKAMSALIILLILGCSGANSKNLITYEAPRLQNTDLAFLVTPGRYSAKPRELEAIGLETQCTAEITHIDGRQVYVGMSSQVEILPGQHNIIVKPQAWGNIPFIGPQIKFVPAWFQRKGPTNLLFTFAPGRKYVVGYRTTKTGEGELIVNDVGIYTSKDQDLFRGENQWFFSQ